jgi:hypothetical protein
MEQMKAKRRAFLRAPRQRGIRRTSGGMGKKLASAKDIPASQVVADFLSARERVQ